MLKTNFKRIISLTIILSLIISFVYPYNVQAKALKLNKTKAVMEIDDQFTLKIKGNTKKITWKSSDKDVVVVSKKGKVTAVDEGKVTITATLGKTKFKCKITVESEDSDSEDENNTEASNIIMSSIISPSILETTPQATTTPTETKIVPTFPPTPIPTATPDPVTNSFKSLKDFICIRGLIDVNGVNYTGGRNGEFYYGGNYMCDYKCEYTESDGFTFYLTCNKLGFSAKMFVKESDFSNVIIQYTNFSTNGVNSSVEYSENYKLNGLFNTKNNLSDSINWSFLLQNNNNLSDCTKKANDCIQAVFKKWENEIISCAGLRFKDLGFTLYNK